MPSSSSLRHRHGGGSGAWQLHGCAACAQVSPQPSYPDKARTGDGSGLVLCVPKQSPQNTVHLYSIHANHCKTQTLQASERSTFLGRTCFEAQNSCHTWPHAVEFPIRDKHSGRWLPIICHALLLVCCWVDYLPWGNSQHRPKCVNWLLPVRGDSQRVPNGAEALGDRLMALVFPRRLLLQMPQPKPKHR